MGLPRMVSVLCLLFLAFLTSVSSSSPSVVLDVIVRNNADSLPYHLYYLQQLDYPKNKLSVRIHCLDKTNNTSETLLVWQSTMKKEYYELTVTFEQGGVVSSGGQQNEEEWRETELRAWRARRNSLQAAREENFDYIFMLDADAILEDPEVLRELVAEKQLMLAPLLKDTDDMWHQEGNFYTADEEMANIVLTQTSTGRFDVDEVVGAVLIALNNQTTLLQLESNFKNVFKTPEVEVGVKLQVLNTRMFGWLPCELIYGVGTSFLHIVFDKPHLERLLYVNITYPDVDNLGFEAIYVINLARRTDRKARMEGILNRLGMKASFVQAVDGWTLTEEYMRDIGVEILPGYVDPIHKRKMKMGEIGCFLSHYTIWKEAERNNYKNVLILEDDARFRPHFRMWAKQGLFEANQIKPDWDLLYLARKPLRRREDSSDDPPDAKHTGFNELFVPDSNLLAYPIYSHWAIGYALSRSGLQKLLWGEPLKKMIPVDELLPLLYGDTWLGDIVEQFAEHPKLKALAIYPHIIHPYHYRGEPEHTYEDQQNRGVSTKDEL